MIHYMIYGAMVLCLFFAGCQQSMPTRKVYLPASCPTITPEAQVVLPKTTPARALKSATSTRKPPKPAQQPTTPGKVILSTATQTQLETLPGIGPALAQRILERRKRRPFRRLEQLRYVKGIGPAKYKKLKPFVALSPPKTPTP